VFGEDRKETTILEMLSEARELYGLDMIERSDGLLQRGVIYVTLARLEEKGLVASREETSQRHPGLPRRLYRITESGRVALKGRGK
jgi:DNA-binding PadR family transcriptional regulator